MGSRDCTQKDPVLGLMLRCCSLDIPHKFRFHFVLSPTKCVAGLGFLSFWAGVGGQGVGLGAVPCSTPDPSSPTRDRPEPLASEAGTLTHQTIREFVGLTFLICKTELKLCFPRNRKWASLVAQQ